jgi:uncharacterized protein (DUF2267 family)
MKSENLLATIEQRARLHGPNQTRRAVCVTLEALADVLPEPVLHRLLMCVPSEITRHLPGDLGRHTAVTCWRDFVAGIAARLHLDAPDATFLARVIFEQLNVPKHGVTPAGVAHLAPADLRPLLSAQAAVSVAAQPQTLKQPATVSRPELGTVIEFPRATRPAAAEAVRALSPA